MGHLTLLEAAVFLSLSHTVLSLFIYKGQLRKQDEGCGNLSKVLEILLLLFSSSLPDLSARARPVGSEVTC